ncbi:uncharacterized protein [Triticum aestivum]|uniref:uncharacterized protein n=1 Tax=Triticum aestivum TaxID=4565 RepID=UPI001D0241E0|nr:uncharacterized protein LOC123171076 [Triticum aestivum]
MDRCSSCRSGLRRPGHPLGIRGAAIGHTDLRLRRPGRPRGIRGVVTGRNDLRGRGVATPEAVGGSHRSHPAVHRSVGFPSTGVQGQSSSAADLRRRRQEIRLGKRPVDSAIAHSSCGFGFPGDTNPAVSQPSFFVVVVELSRQMSST